jgi:hypothetical protein
MISKPNVATMVKTHFEIDTSVMKVDNEMAISKYKLGRTLLKDVLIDEGANVNIIT